MASISDILIARGQQEAESRRARAGAWVPFLQSMAQIPGQIMADRQAGRDRQQAMADAAQQREARSVQIARGQQDLAAGDRAASTAQATAEQQAHMRDVLASPGVIGTDGRFDIATAQRIATEKGYQAVLPDVGKFGHEWNDGIEKSLLTQAQTASANRANQPKGPEPFTLSPGQQRFGPDGHPLASVAAEEKPDTRALNIQLAEAIKRGDRPAMNAIRQAIRQAADAGHVTDTPEPVDVGGDVRTTLSGKRYIDLGDYQTPTERAKAQASAKAIGVDVVPKEVGMSLQSADTAKQNITAMMAQIESKLPKDAAGRIVAGPGNKLSQYFQTDADLAAFNSWRAGAIQAVQALVERGMGFRLNQAEINMIMQNDMPQVTDTLATARRRTQNVLTLLENKENSLLTKDRSTLAPRQTGERLRVVGPNGETGTVPRGTPLPAGWRLQ